MKTQTVPATCTRHSAFRKFEYAKGLTSTPIQSSPGMAEYVVTGRWSVSASMVTTQCSTVQSTFVVDVAGTTLCYSQRRAKVDVIGPYLQTQQQKVVKSANSELVSFCYNLFAQSSRREA